MRGLGVYVLAMGLTACSGAPDSIDFGDDSGGGSGGSDPGAGGVPSGTGGGASDPIDFPDDDSSDEDATVDDALDPGIAAPTQLDAAATSLAGITSDDRVVYRAAGGLWSIKAAKGAPPRKAASVAGEVVVHGRTIFNFADVDWGAGLGDLTFWTPAIGRRSVGRAMMGEARVAARHDDAYVLFALDVQAETLDVVIASADAGAAEVLVEDASLGSDDTCGPGWRFAGDAAIVSWCQPGSMEATLARFALDAGGQWQRTDITDTAQGGWSSDATGTRLFYLELDGQAWVTDMGNVTKISDGVRWGTLHPGGGTVFFTVGDQLRRRDLSGSPIPIVVEGFAQPVAWTAGMGRVVYSSTVLYDEGQKQDLFVTSTDWFNPTPTVLVDQPIATLGRSVLTDSGAHAIYFTDVGALGGNLHLHPVNGAPAVSVAGDVKRALAAAGSLVLLSNNATAPGVYPALVDLLRVDAAKTAAPKLIEAGILDVRVEVRSDKLTVAYLRDGTADASAGGLWLRPVLP